MPMRTGATLLGKGGGKQKDTVGGLHGDIPTRDIPLARRAFMDYVENFTGSDEDRLDFADFARRWKRNKKQ